ncbi:MAG: GspH/FimT family pseudopilin [Gammaproteobacteria bacterium]|nr:GspH/FimT family pseudopilin [Gammaproteobacteria bacterium]
MDVEKRPHRRARGITLIELLTTVAVVSISLALLAPGWGSINERNRVTTAANSLLADLRYARSTAVTRNRRISLCPSSDGNSCNGQPHSWHAGYIIFVDSDSNRQREPDEKLLQVRDAQGPGLHIHSTAGRPAISFRPDGAAWSTNTSFSICHGGSPAANRAVILYGSGRARVDRVLPDNRAVDCS